MKENTHDERKRDRREFIKNVGTVGLLAGGIGSGQTVEASSLNDGGYSVEGKDSNKWTEQMQEYYGGPFVETTTEVATGVGEFTWSAVDGSEYWHKVIEPEMLATTWKQGNRYDDIQYLYLSITYPEQYTVNAENRDKSRGAYNVPNKDTSWDPDDEEAVETLMSGLISIVVNNPAFSATQFVAEMGGALTELYDSTAKVKHTWDINNLNGSYQDSAGAWFKATAEMLKNECMDYTVKGLVDRYNLDTSHDVQISNSTCAPSYSPNEAISHSASASDYEGETEFMTISPSEFRKGKLDIKLPAEAKRPLQRGTPIVVEMAN